MIASACAKQKVGLFNLVDSSPLSCVSLHVRRALTRQSEVVQEAEHLLFGQQDEFDNIMKEETKARLEPARLSFTLRCPGKSKRDPELGQKMGGGGARG